MEPAKLDTYKEITCKASVIFPCGPASIRADASAKVPTITIDPLYAGGPVQPEGAPVPIVAEVSGIRTNRDQVPILQDHNPDLLVGHGVPTITNGEIRFAGLVSAVGQAAKEVLGANANGFKWQASIGLNRVPGEDQPYRIIHAGETIRANGQTFQGPLIYWPTSLLVHAALTGQGADPETHVTIAAKAAKPQGVRKMDEFELWVKDTLGLEPSTLTDSGKQELRASYNAKKAASHGQPGHRPANCRGQEASWA